MAKKDMHLYEVIGDTVSKEIYRALEIQAIRGGLIKTSKHLRGLGKTTALVQFAKNYELGVVVANRSMAEYIKHELNYSNVFYEYSPYISSVGRYVVDEGVNLSILKDKPVTGFISEEF